MLFDDRLATVLRSPARGEAGARTQFRQLLDLLGSSPAEEAGLSIERYEELSAMADRLSPEDRDNVLLRPALEGRDPTLLTFLAYRRLGELGADIPAEERSRILREPGLRLRNRRLVHILAQGDSKTAAAAVATARLSDEDWVRLIPQLPVMARGFLRHRRDLPEGAKRALGQLGVRDLVLPMPEGAQASAPTATAPETEKREREDIRNLLRRIEAFREGRSADSGAALRLPLGDTQQQADAGESALASFAFTTDGKGRIDWADPAVAPLVEGMLLAAAGPGVIAVLDEYAADAMRSRRPLLGARLSINAAPAISGDWRVDAAPVFAPEGGYFTGYSGRIRRPVFDAVATGEAQGEDSAGDRMRQMLHELRTPVNAIQGFAEIIQQQLFGPAPNEYRALAAAVAVDAAKLLAGFDEVDRITRLETGALELDVGEGDLRDVVSDTIRRLDGALRSRGAGFDLTVSGSPFTPGLAREELLALAWRIFASIAGSLAPAERSEITLDSDGETIVLTCQLPAALAAMDDPFRAPLPEKRPALSAGMFGSGFALRLARAEIASTGGSLEREDNLLVARLRVLTAPPAANTNAARDDNAA